MNYLRQPRTFLYLRLLCNVNYRSKISSELAVKFKYNILYQMKLCSSPLCIIKENRHASTHAKY